MSVSDVFGFGLTPTAESNTIAYNMEAIWLPNALQDAALLHTTIFVASYHMDMTRGMPSSAITLHHKASAFRSINERMQRDTETEDTTLLSLLGLWFHEVC